MFFVEGLAVDAGDLELHPTLQLATETFLQQASLHTSTAPFVYSFQAEEVTISANAAAILCTSDATTCVAAVLVATATAADDDSGPLVARIVHHDECTTASPSALQQTVAGLGHAAKLWLVGAYLDPEGRAQQSAAALLSFLHRCSVRLDVQLCCLGRANTCPLDGSPRCTSLAVDLKMLQACAAPPAPHQRGPLLPARMAQWAYPQHSSSVHSSGGFSFAGSPLRSLRLSDDGHQLRMALCHGRPPAHVCAAAQHLLSLDDTELLQQHSTSPLHEPPHFAAGRVVECQVWGWGGCVQGSNWCDLT